MRILGVTVVVVALALGGSVLLLRAVLLRDLASQTDQRLVQESEEFSGSVAANPPFADEPPAAYAERVLRAYLETNVPDGDEAFVAVVSGTPLLASPDAPASLLDDIEWLRRNSAPIVSRFDRAATDAGVAVTLSIPLVIEGVVQGAFVVAVWEEPGRDRVDTAVRVAASVSGIALLGAAALAWGTAGRVLRPLRDLAATSKRISENDLSERIPTGGRDEVGRLVETYNEMLDRLERSFVGQRAFLDDAGHELRTPLTIIRGHLEVAADQASWERSKPTVLAELDRMARIVDDLLLLAKAEQPDFLRVGAVDLDELVLGAAERARVLAGGERTVVVDAAPPAVIAADSQRLVQALVNLVANAVRHTAAGGTVAVGAAVDGTDARIWVRDDGEGIAPADHERVFRRFSSARSRRGSGGSAGLGLAIVDAIATAHQGSVQLDSSPGSGATFTIHLPNTVSS